MLVLRSVVVGRLIGLGLFAACLGFAVPARAGTVIEVDFDTDALGQPILPGEVVHDQYAALGLTIIGRQWQATPVLSPVAQDTHRHRVEPDHTTPATARATLVITATS